MKQLNTTCSDLATCSILFHLFILPFFFARSAFYHHLMPALLLASTSDAPLDDNISLLLRRSPHLTHSPSYPPYPTASNRWHWSNKSTWTGRRLQIRNQWPATKPGQDCTGTRRSESIFSSVKYLRLTQYQAHKETIAICCICMSSQSQQYSSSCNRPSPRRWEKPPSHPDSRHSSIVYPYILNILLNPAKSSPICYIYPKLNQSTLQCNTIQHSPQHSILHSLNLSQTLSPKLSLTLSLTLSPKLSLTLSLQPHPELSLKLSLQPRLKISLTPSLQPHSELSLTLSLTRSLTLSSLTRNLMLIITLSLSLSPRHSLQHSLLLHNLSRHFNAQIKRGGVEAFRYNILYPDTLGLLAQACISTSQCARALLDQCILLFYHMLFEQVLFCLHIILVSKHTDLSSDVPSDPYLHTILSPASVSS